MAGTIGKRLLPTTIDKLAQADPNRAWGSIPSKDSWEFHDISMFAFANAINRIAHWIVKEVGAPPAKRPKIPLSYVGPSDLRYYVLIVAIVKAGYVPLFVSHLNSKAANASLFAATGCSTLLCGFSNLDHVQSAPEDAKVYYIPSVEETWDETPVPLFPYDVDFEEAYRDPFIIIHTSGSTGLPKPITYTHRTCAIWDTRAQVPGYDGYETNVQIRARCSRHFIGFPPFHAAGLTLGLQDSIFFGTTIVFPPADRPLNAQAMVKVIEHGRVDGVAVLPHHIEDIAQSPEALQRLREIRFISWAGGPISDKAGDLISAETILFNSYASTELGSSLTLVGKDPSLWNWYYFLPHANGFDFRLLDGQHDTHELFVVKDPSILQPVFTLFPDRDEWPMNDLFIPHPTLAHYWRLVGRSDDLIVLQNGNKVNPRAIEILVKTAPDVHQVLMFGARRTRPGMLIEPVDASLLDESNTAARSDFLDAVYTFVEASNRTAADSGVIIRDLVALTKSDKPFPLSGKGTIQRASSLALYEDEIDSLYEALPSDLQEIKDFRIGVKLS